MKNFIIGIDVSKEKLDFCLLEDENIVREWICLNTTAAISQAFKKLKFPLTELLVCAEYTGQYAYPLSVVCEELGIDLWLENPAQIKYRSGVQRGKNDRIDARKIAFYAVNFQKDARLFSLPEKNIATLKQLIAERDMLIADKGKYQGQITDQKRFMDKKDYEEKKKRLQKLIAELEKCIAAIEEKIDRVINSDETLTRQHELLLSVTGVGERTAVKMIVETNAFRDFKDPRKFCCHAGVAPFQYTSGTSVHSKNRVSRRADKTIKSLLHLAALSAATHAKGELNEYYLRKVAEGKNKMSVLNAVRAKIVYRMFAVIRFNKFYEKNYAFELA
jgi:transposase